MAYRTSDTAEQKGNNHISKYILQNCNYKRGGGLIMEARQRRQQYTWHITEQGHVFVSSISVYHIMVEKCNIAHLAVIQWCKSSDVWVKEI